MQSGRWRYLRLKQATRSRQQILYILMCVDEWVLMAGKQPKILSRNLWNSPVMHVSRLLSLARAVPSHFKHPQKWCVAAEPREGVCRQSLSFRGRKDARTKFEGERLLAEPARWHEVLRRQRREINPVEASNVKKNPGRIFFATEHSQSITT